MYYNLFIHSSVHGHLVCSHVLAIVNSAAVQDVNGELPAVHTGFRKGRGTRDQIANIEKAREFQKKHLFLPY